MKNSRLFLLVATIISLTACGGGSDTSAPTPISPVVTSQSVSVDEDNSVAIDISADTDNAIADYVITSNPDNGVLTGVAPELTYTPNGNFNGSDSFAFMAVDQSGVASNIAVITISVAAVNDAPVLLVTAATADPRAENEAIGTVVSSAAQMQSYSTDIDSTLTYSISAGNDAGIFAIDTNSGEVTLALVPNEAQTGNHILSISASDGEFSVTTQLTVNVTSDDTVPDLSIGLNTTAPVITSASSVNVNENTTMVLTLTATDADNLPGQTQGFSVGGTDAGLFDISGNALSFNNSPDFENPICGGDNVCNISITPTDGTNTGAAQSVTITLVNLNDTAPVISSASSAVSVNENTTAVLTVTATDADNDTISFSITGGVDSNLFTFNNAQLSFNSPPDFENPICGGDNVCSIAITATDGVNTGVTQSVTITLVNLNDTAPIMSSASSVNVNENTTAVLTLTATDADNLPGQTQGFSVGGTDAGLFDISGNALSFNNSPDFENPICGGDNVCNISITPTDGTNTGAAQSVTITLVNLNDTAPIMSSASSVNVNENTTAVLTLTATDADNLPGQTQGFSVGGTDAGLFDISGNALSFNNSPDFENPICGGDNVCNISITPTDGTNTGAAQSVTVTLINLNDTAPIMSSASSVNVNENTTAVLTLTATDADNLPGQTQGFSVGGTDAGLFDISGNALSFNNSPDFENPICGGDNVCNISITPTDGTNIGAAQSVSVTLVDIVNLSAVDASIIEGDAGTSTLQVTITLASVATASVDFAITDGSATLANNDYTATATVGTANFSATTLSQINIIVIGDTDIEPDEILTITLSNASNLELPQTPTIEVTIVNDEQLSVINDTGIQFSGDFPADDNANCLDTIDTPVLAQQDCSQGRDAQALAGTLVKVGAGAAGFDFTKLGATGTVLAIQDAAYSTTGNEANGTIWSCVRDNHTGLIWQVETDDGSVYDRESSYAWGGLTAIGINSPVSEGIYDNDPTWDVLVNTANGVEAGSDPNGLCGFTDWRVPNVSTLATIVNRGTFNPAIDLNFFPNVVQVTTYWSSSPAANSSDRARSVLFTTGVISSNLRVEPHKVRLVRGGQ